MRPSSASHDAASAGGGRVQGAERARHGGRERVAVERRVRVGATGLAGGGGRRAGRVAHRVVGGGPASGLAVPAQSGPPAPVGFGQPPRAGVGAPVPGGPRNP